VGRELTEKGEASSSNAEIPERVIARRPGLRREFFELKGAGKDKGEDSKIHAVK
jgi:hypothetical protein